MFYNLTKLFTKISYLFFIALILNSCGDKNQTHSKGSPKSTPSVINPTTEGEDSSSQSTHKSIPSVNSDTKDEDSSSQSTSSINSNTEDVRYNATDFSKRYYNTFVKYNNSTKKYYTLYDYFVEHPSHCKYFTEVLKKRFKDPNASEAIFLNFIRSFNKILFVNRTYKNLIFHSDNDTLSNFINQMDMPDPIPSFEVYEASDYLFSTKILRSFTTSEFDEAINSINLSLDLFPGLDKEKDFWSYFESILRS